MAQKRAEMIEARDAGGVRGCEVGAESVIGWLVMSQSRQ